MVVAGFVVEVVVDTALSTNATAFLFFLVLLHGVLKWLHQPLLKYVMLSHAVESWHDFLHWSRLETFPGEFWRYTSPAFVSHSIREPISCHVRFASGDSRSEGNVYKLRGIGIRSNHA